MSIVLKDLADLKGSYNGRFEFDIIPRYFPPTKFPEVRWLVKSWQKGEGYIDAYISGEIHGFAADRKISDLSMWYKPFLEIEPEIKEKLKKLNRETELPVSIEVTSHYKNLERNDLGVWVRQTKKDKVQLNQMIEFLEKVERLIVESVSITFYKHKKEQGLE